MWVLFHTDNAFPDKCSATPTIWLATREATSVLDKCVQRYSVSKTWKLTDIQKYESENSKHKWKE